MARYVFKRILQLIPVVLAVAILIFTIMYFVPGDPAETICGAGAMEEELAATREALGLNRSYIERLIDFLKQTFLHFDFGKSYITHVSIKTELLRRIPYTLMIGAGTFLVVILIGVPLGIIAAVNQNRLGDRISMIIALFGVSVPQFWYGMLLVLLFSVQLDLLPATGVSSWKSFILPCFACAIGGLATNARQARSAMLEVIRSDYIITAKAKGIPYWKVILKHALPNALIPILTTLRGMLAGLCGGSVVIETVFTIPGLGTYLVTGMNNRDYPIVQACVIILALISAVVVLLVDIIYAFVDPRIKAKYAGNRKVRRRGNASVETVR